MGRLKEPNNNIRDMSLQRSPPTNGKHGEVKLVVLGRTAVGKSATVVRFLTRRFIWEYDPTLEFTYRHQVTIDEEPITMEILDTAGQENNIHREGHVRWGDGFLVVYSVNDRQSFVDVGHIKDYLDEIKKHRNVSMVIVANKSDLEHERVVSTEEGEKLATDLACAFFETSACDGDEQIREAFHELYREVRRRKALEGKQRRRSSSQQVKQVINKMLNKINSNHRT
ncbi:ras-related and estrogen-regulated growth inhibitor-like [Saccoglossus kowalevskii]|uniref:small monomeric GTPase n=1 Tax=Saccoglossus kowalevskii TaxID=10224 RepID=A0ABM0MGM8_SACKO|nr:PREDICTED: ras-related and estrogen-regulated growth inhibitor-like isoform X1 [Saccoglossus kowalevskii]XP_006819169.1 PREDICTED: ras-related and estrogen-regulated growth inhibitor-like isoform X2 [Saccoglossus kowalevskii]